ncbi:MAG: ABC transporter ATP-binding protein [Herbiconiux sp.]|uniref:ABC transporter ATP-binding protein n=1 Tax=Herbiconiux sp. TaxID=1871186 RepID=UPI00120899C2|nr:ABC transporter ATP-binding protein [Herbiconiux sp.]TAJ46926.1 MAG: ABC transporter ATP-binding protein [Herbiconiux sp.]
MMTSPAMTASEPVPFLSIEDLHVRFDSARGVVHAVRGVNMRVGKGERLGIVGESGSGKSVTAHTILRLMPDAQISGRIMMGDKDLVSASSSEMRGIRGRKIGMVFQDPMTSLDPVRTIGSQVVEAGRHRGLGRREARAEAIDLLGSLGIPRPSDRFDEYPHHFSGGMRQRVVIAAALMGAPELLIADEPTTALDVRLQARLLDMLWVLSQERDMSVMLVSHDLALVAGFADRVAVMYAGAVQESAQVDRLFDRPAHPYTDGLISSAPRLDAYDHPPLVPIPGSPPPPSVRMAGCRFAPRCPRAAALCREEEPALLPLADQSDHRSACHFAEQVQAHGPIPAASVASTSHNG